MEEEEKVDDSAADCSAALLRRALALSRFSSIARTLSGVSCSEPLALLVEASAEVDDDEAGGGGGVAKRFMG